MRKNAHIKDAHALPWNVECKFKADCSGNCRRTQVQIVTLRTAAAAPVLRSMVTPGFFVVVDKVVEITIARSGHRLFIKFQLDGAQ